jgi:hypothetical protein
VFLLAYAGVFVGAAMLYWFSRLISDKPSRFFALIAVFAVVFTFADSYIKIVQKIVFGGTDDLLLFVLGLVPTLILAALVGGVSLYFLVKNEEKLDNWILIYVGTIIALMFL